MIRNGRSRRHTRLVGFVGWDCGHRLVDTGRRRAITLIEILIIIFVAVIIAGMILPMLARPCGEDTRKMRCRTHLKQIHMAMTQYVDTWGEHKWYPFPVQANHGDYNGAHFLAALYWSGVMTEPALFLCQESKDTNHDGQDLGTHAPSPKFSGQTVSYASKGRSNCFGKAMTDSYPPETAMACDDTEGSRNHKDGMNILFFDSRAEWNGNLDPRNAVGKTPPLDALEN